VHIDVSAPISRSRKKTPTVRGLKVESNPTHSWLSRNGCVEREGDEERVVVAGAVLGAWHRGETAMRNPVLLYLSHDRQIVLEDLAKAFGLSSEMVRRAELRPRPTPPGRGFRGASWPDRPRMAASLYRKWAGARLTGDAYSSISSRHRLPRSLTSPRSSTPRSPMRRS
jgi:hypothetical protein